MRIFQKPKLSEKMPLNESIYKNPKELALLKGKVSPEEYLSSLYEKIATVEKDLVIWESDLKRRKADSETEFIQKKTEKERLFKVLENTLETLRQQRDAAEIPVFEKLKVLDEREIILNEREKQVFAEKQEALRREEEASVKLEDVQILADQLGETRVRQMIKEKSLKELEKALQHNENLYLLKVERFSHEVNESAALIQERENTILLKEQNIESKEENLAKREEALINERLLIQSQRQALMAAKNDSLTTKRR